MSTDRAAEGRTATTDESFLLVLGGTLDLFAGGGAWQRRGRRANAFDRDERPVGVFLPPNTPWKAAAGQGDVLVVAVRQPEEPEPPAPEEAAAKKPLLQLSGSGKAFDSSSQSWIPQEAFLSSPEAILPRRIEASTDGDGVVGRRILPADYKTLGLALDEAVIPPGVRWQPSPPTVPGGGWPEEWLAFTRVEGAGDQVFAGRAADAPTFVAPTSGALYVAITYAGSKSST